MTTPTCSRCPSPARWRDGDGRHFCAGHVPANGRPLARMPAAEIDIIERLLESSPTEDLCCEAAGEIRRLRAELDKSSA